ncbi:OVARIAN TUMOR DOMAIN-containing deubiquitinating enzyme 9-like [Drosophila madeirensis]|uniref:OVARIAN TUMOR DOMAIN-containing deubiquitinating enzyme 9-like n=1 Tax=Drosophila madeirensis TaxID=30013 RepID=A0AAU9FZ51_DROMD
MQMEMLKIQGLLVPHYVVPIKGDGSCLFRALSFLMFNSQEQAPLVRRQIVQLVASDWHTFRTLSHDEYGNNYRSSANYLEEMSQPFCYGGYCELIAAARIYNFRFEVFRSGEMYADAGNHGRPVRRMRFTQDLSSGHFDAYVPK